MLARLVHSIRRVVRWLWHTARLSAPVSSAQRPSTAYSDVQATTTVTEVTTDGDVSNRSGQPDHIKEPRLEAHVQPEHTLPAANPTRDLVAEDAFGTSDSLSTKAAQALRGDTGHVDSRTSPTRVNQLSDRAKNPEPAQSNISDEQSNASPEQPKRRRTPVKSGGQRTKRNSSRAPTPREPLAARPELICRQNHELQWELVLSVSDESSIKDVQHNEMPLDLVNRECTLSSFRGHIRFVSARGKQEAISLEDKKKPLVFKLQKNWIGDGRRVRGIGTGYYIVIVPRAYERTGRVPVEHAACTDTGFTAHYFVCDRESPQEIGSFHQCKVPLTKSVIELKGKRVFDDSEDGDLFVGIPPSLRPSEDVVWVRVGEENGWKGENFKARERDVGAVLGDRQGRFFVRVYDTDTELLDSEQFRYLRNLREILVNGAPYSEGRLLVPPPTGHLPTEVRFVGVDSATLRSALSLEAKHTKVQGTSLFVDPHPNVDRISCVLESDTDRIDVVLHLPRLWWLIEEEGIDTSEWCDEPITMTRQEFRNRGYDGATVRLRVPRRIKSVHVGFDGQHDRSYSSKQEERSVLIPLQDFVNRPQIEQHLGEDTLFNIECDGVAVTVIRIAADPVPDISSFVCKPAKIIAGDPATLRWKTNNADEAKITINPHPHVGPIESKGSLEVSPLKTTTYKLTLIVPGVPNVTKVVTVTVLSSVETDHPIARVRCQHGGWRRGKGFSRGELEVAGLTSADADYRSILVDLRRRSTHRENVETIRRFING